MTDRRYQLRRMPIARGGMGDVWQGWDTLCGREVAAKFPRLPEGHGRAEMVRGFLREARLMSRVRHPGVPAVLRVGFERDVPYLVMRRVPGDSVSDLLATTGRLPWQLAASVAAGVCAVLVAAEDAGVVHGDIRPANLILEPDSSVSVVDFGLARESDVPAMPNSDLYSLGRTVHEMLTGLPPERSDAFLELHGVPGWLDSLRRELLDPDPCRRPVSARAVHKRFSEPFDRALTP